MKLRNDPRHIRRIKNMQAMFAWDAGNPDPTTEDSQKIIENIVPINEMIVAHAPKWPIDKINKVDLAILRCAVWELTVQQKTPPKVVVDEAVELAKEFGTDNSSSFVNGVLGSLITKNDTPNNDSQ